MPKGQTTKITTDHDEIRRWAEARGGKPATVARTHKKNETGIIRLDFPGYSGGKSLQGISWKEFFKKFDDEGLAFVYQDKTATGRKSSFNRFVKRDTAAARARLGSVEMSGSIGRRKATSAAGGARRAARKTGTTASARGASTAKRRATSATRGTTGVRVSSTTRGAKTARGTRGTTSRGTRGTMSTRASTRGGTTSARATAARGGAATSRRAVGTKRAGGRARLARPSSSRPNASTGAKKKARTRRA